MGRTKQLHKIIKQPAGTVCIPRDGDHLVSMMLLQCRNQERTQ
jgi:hypothetical protein